MRRIEYFFLTLCVVVSIIFVGFKFANDNSLEAEWLENREVITICVHYGDTLDEICYQYKPSWMDVREFRYYILDLNGMSNSMLYAGQTLKIYAYEGE